MEPCETRSTVAPPGDHLHERSAYLIFMTSDHSVAECCAHSARGAVAMAYGGNVPPCRAIRLPAPLVEHGHDASGKCQIFWATRPAIAYYKARRRWQRAFGDGANPVDV